MKIPGIKTLARLPKHTLKNLVEDNIEEAVYAAGVFNIKVAAKKQYAKIRGRKFKVPYLAEKLTYMYLSGQLKSEYSGKNLKLGFGIPGKPLLDGLSIDQVDKEKNAYTWKNIAICTYSENTGKSIAFLSDFDRTPLGTQSVEYYKDKIINRAPSTSELNFLNYKNLKKLYREKLGKSAPTLYEIKNKARSVGVNDVLERKELKKLRRKDLRG